MVEWFNWILRQHLSKVVDKYQEDWDCYILLFMLAYQYLIYESTLYIPPKMIFGHELRLPFNLEFGALPEKQIPINEFAMEMRNNLKRTYTIVKN